jgi:hypothetical protein
VRFTSLLARSLECHDLVGEARDDLLDGGRVLDRPR